MRKGSVASARYVASPASSAGGCEVDTVDTSFWFHVLRCRMLTLDHDKLPVRNLLGRTACGKRKCSENAVWLSLPLPAKQSGRACALDFELRGGWRGTWGAIVSYIVSSGRRLRWSTQLVADSADCVNQFRTESVIDLFAQIIDVHVDDVRPGVE